MRLILASASPRRKELLSQAGVEFDILPAAIDESQINSETPEKYVTRLSLEKACSIKTDRPVLGADTVVSIDGKLLGKPSSEQEALAMLMLLNGRTHLVHTGVSLVWGLIKETLFTVTEVTFISATQSELINYINTKEPFDKAGGYGIQGIGAFLVESIIGSYTGVVGLPVSQTLKLLKKHNLWN